MTALIATLREVWGLFVEDASFTLGILACLAVAIYVFPRMLATVKWGGPLLFGLLAAVLIENVYRSAHK